MNANEIEELLYSIPEAVDYTNEVDEVELEDIPEEKVNQLICILNHQSEYEFRLIFRIGIILCHWGVEEGFIYVSSLLLSPKKELIRKKCLDENDCKYILSSLISYGASISDKGYEIEARKKIYPCIKALIELAKEIPFSLALFYYLIDEDGYTEYVPLIKDYLEHLLKNSTNQRWDIYDTAELLLKIDPDFVENIFKENEKKLSDFGLGSNSESSSAKAEKKKKGYFWWLK